MQVLGKSVPAAAAETQASEAAVQRASQEMHRHATQPTLLGHF